MLAAGAAGPEGVDADILFVEIDVDGVVEFRHDHHRGEGGVAAAAGVKGRDPHQPVDAELGPHIAVGIAPLDEDGDTLGAGLVARQDIEDIGAEALAFRPAQVHAQQDAHPVLGLGAAGPGVDGDDGVVVVVLAAEHALHLGHEMMSCRSGQPLRDLIEGLAVVLLHAHVEEQVDLLQFVPFSFPAFDHFLQLPVFLLDFLGYFGLVPEVGGQGLPLQPLQFVFLLSQVKDAPSGPARRSFSSMILCFETAAPVSSVMAFFPQNIIDCLRRCRDRAPPQRLPLLSSA